jgi:NAD(P)-dependent dehydrogenase (short-subunit alcohol dehydrogenase family)
VSTGVVTGAAGGIGSACVRALAGSAELLVLAGRRREPLERIAREVDGRTAVVPADIATTEGRDAVLAAVEGPLAWAVLASGVPARKPLRELEEEEIAATFAANLLGPTLLLRRLLNAAWQPPASVIVIGSISATRSLPGRSVYGSSKAGIEHLAQSLAAEVAGSGLRVNVVAPGVIETPFLGEAAGALTDWVKVRVPQARAGAPDEVAQLVRYLILDAPAYLTGARIAVDGGAETVA